MFDDRATTPRALWVGTLIFCVIVIADSWFRWATFQYTTFDLAFYAQGLWQVGKGMPLVSLLDVPLMGNHQEPIVYLIAPLFKIWSHPMLLVFIQTLALATMPFTGWRIARRLEFSSGAAMWLGLATLLAPATGFVALHEFHPEALAAPLLLAMLEARMKERLGSFWLWFILVLACKENMALLLVSMCMVHYVIEARRGREWRMAWNLIPGCFALGWLVLCVFWIGPSLNRGRVDYLELYSHLGDSGATIVSGFFSEPGKAAGALWRAITGGNLIGGLLVPFLLLPLLRPRWVIVALPIVLQHLLSYRSSEWGIRFHYAAPLVPLLWFGAVEAGAKLFWRDTMAVWVAVACVVCQPWFGPARNVWRTIAGSPEALRARSWKQEMLAAIPSDVSVTAGMPYLSHLAKRERLYSLHHILKGLKTLSRKEYKPPAPTDAVVVDTADVATFDREAGNFHPRMRTVTGQIIPSSDMLLHDFLSQAEWHKLSRNEFTIFLKDKPPTTDAPGGQGRKLDDFHSLLSIQAVPPMKGDAMLFRIAWDLQPKRPWLLWASLYLEDGSGQLTSIGKGPIAVEQKSGRLTELWAVRPPSSLKPGKYRGSLLVEDPFDVRTPEGMERFKRVRFDVGEFDLQ